MTAPSTHKFQAPKGTRDFPPPEMAVRRHIESVWRDVSQIYGFDEVDGPTFEHLELYTVKSGPGIVSELFSFRRAGGDADYALRPEFTPTLARMVAATAAQLPRPIKWFCMPPMFRAERPQRGRLREHYQWNVDIVGEPTVRAEVELIAVAVSALRRFGLTDDDVQIRMSHRGLASHLLAAHGVDASQLPDAFALLDRRDKTTPQDFAQRAAELGLDDDGVALFARRREVLPLAAVADGSAIPVAAGSDALGDLAALRDQLDDAGVGSWCGFDLGIVRGLAYYTGLVFEVHETTGRERAVAGGGRYDQLIEMFGGPPTPAAGFAMGDVVIRLVLEEQGLLEPAEHYLPRPDAFVISSGSDAAEAHVAPLVARLRGAGLHARHTYRATRNVGKLLGEAGRCRARHAVILGDGLDDGHATVKDLDAGTQREVPLADLVDALGGAAAPTPAALEQEGGR